MENEFPHMSTAELVQFATPNRYKFRSIAINGVLGQLILNAVNVLQDASAFEDEQGNVSSEELQAELAALYDDACYNLLVRVLSSAVVDTRALAGATYLLALLTAGSSVYAEGLRNKMVKGVGTIRLVALLSQDSESVKCNALLVMGNLLRHCSAVHSEFLRLGGIRKLAALFRQAHEEPQQNVCMDAFLSLCDSRVPGVLDELTTTGCVGLVLELVTMDTSERVLKKALHALKMMLSKDSPTRSSILELSLVKSVLSVICNGSHTHLLNSLWILENICQGKEGEVHRRKFVKHGGVKFLVTLLDSTEDRETELQVVQILASLAALDVSVRATIAALDASCLTSLRAKLEHIEIEPPEHPAALQYLLTVCDNSRHLEELHGNLAFEASGRVGEGFAHSELVCT
eukprot:TRINITY_DN14574_c0_g1_i1.p1 TRINITY_DN14574_c0_g1~~TRINITY_DN14574_c0_g1_i1.p1  ORF type:complete len:403 (-),score=67.85 TRINITY_DN14574_c0_g1_i1:336-1544(-)